MTDRITAVTSLIDSVLDGNDRQHSPERAHTSLAPEGMCWRCQTAPTGDGPSDLCGPCRSFLLEDSDSDPTAPWDWTPSRAIAGGQTFELSWADRTRTGYGVYTFADRPGPAPTYSVPLPVCEAGDTIEVTATWGDPDQPEPVPVRCAPRDLTDDQFDALRDLWRTALAPDAAAPPDITYADVVEQFHRLRAAGAAEHEPWHDQHDPPDGAWGLRCECGWPLGLPRPP